MTESETRRWGRDPTRGRVAVKDSTAARAPSWPCGFFPIFVEQCERAHVAHGSGGWLAGKTGFECSQKRKRRGKGRATSPRVCSRERLHCILVLQLILVHTEWRFTRTQRLAGFSCKRNTQVAGCGAPICYQLSETRLSKERADSRSARRKVPFETTHRETPRA